MCIYIYNQQKRKRKKEGCESALRSKKLRTLSPLLPHEYNTRFLYCIYEYCTRWKYGTSCTVACSLPRERVVEVATLPPTDGGSCVSSLYSSLLYGRLLRLRGFSSRLRDRGLPRTVPTFLHLDEDERKKDTVQGFCACIVVVVIV